MLSFTAKIQIHAFRNSLNFRTKIKFWYSVQKEHVKVEQTVLNGWKYFFKESNKKERGKDSEFDLLTKAN